MWSNWLANTSGSHIENDSMSIDECADSSSLLLIKFPIRCTPSAIVEIGEVSMVVGVGHWLVVSRRRRAHSILEECKELKRPARHIGLNLRDRTIVNYSSSRTKRGCSWLMGSSWWLSHC